MHPINLSDGVVTPGNNGLRRLSAIREMMELVSYQGQDVLDIGTAEGMWLFEAAKLGSANCVGTDVRIGDWGKFLLAKKALSSRAVHLLGCPMQDLSNRIRIADLPHLFDIVQHLRLFSLLRYPLISFTKARDILRIGSILLLETSAILGDLPALMLWNGDTENIRFGGPSTTWAHQRMLCSKKHYVVLHLSHLIQKNESNLGHAWMT